MSNTNGMVEVITEAYFNKFFPQPMPIPEHRARVAEVRELAVYLAANLEAAGFGPVKEAQAEALEEAAGAWREYLPAVAGYGKVQPVPVWLERRAEWTRTAVVWGEA